MIPPPRPQEPSRNPRAVLADAGPAALAQALARTGYHIQDTLLDDYAQVLRSGKVWLIEGEPGAGKSAVAYATQAAFNLTLFPVQGMSELTLGDLLYEWDRNAQSQFVLQAVQAGAMSLAEAQAAQYGLPFLKLGRALHAFQWAQTTHQVPLFFFDEVDKLPEPLQDILLGLLESGFSYVSHYGQPLGVYDPQTGLSERSLWPLCIFTSNNLRCPLSPPFRSRCFYSWLDKPTPPEEVRILCARVPTATPAQVRAVACLNESLKAIPGVAQKPGLRELIDLLAAVVRDGVPELSESTLSRYLGYLAKQQSHLRALRLALARVASDIQRPDAQIEAWVQAAFGPAQVRLAA